jgi:hypothetical protein
MTFWRHFGSWNGTLYLCDLGHIENVKRRPRVAASMRELRGRMVANGENHSTIPKRRNSHLLMNQKQLLVLPEPHRRNGNQAQENRNRYS